MILPTLFTGLIALGCLTLAVSIACDLCRAIADRI